MGLFRMVVSEVGCAVTAALLSILALSSETILAYVWFVIHPPYIIYDLVANMEAFRLSIFV